jgi:hypothetical protein
MALTIIFKKMKGLAICCVFEDRCVSPLKGHVTSEADTGVKIHPVF